MFLSANSELELAYVMEYELCISKCYDGPRLLVIQQCMTGSSQPTKTRESVLSALCVYVCVCLRVLQAHTRFHFSY